MKTKQIQYFMTIGIRIIVVLSLSYLLTIILISGAIVIKDGFRGPIPSSIFIAGFFAALIGGLVFLYAEKIVRICAWDQDENKINGDDKIV